MWNFRMEERTPPFKCLIVEWAVTHQASPRVTKSKERKETLAPSMKDLPSVRVLPMGSETCWLVQEENDTLLKPLETAIILLRPPIRL